MEEIIIALIAFALGLALLIVVLVGSIEGIIAFRIARKCRRQLQRLEDRLDALGEAPVERPAAPAATVPDASDVRPTGEPPPAPPRPEELVAKKPPSSVPEKERDVAAAMPPGEPPRGRAARALALVLNRETWARFEVVVGKHWMTWAGVVVLFLSVGLFVKHAFDQGWLGPTARVALGIVFGIMLLALGDWLVRRRMRPLGLGLMGGGLAILYLSLFAAFGFYKLIPQSAAFVLLIAVSAAGMTLAVLHDAISVSVLATLGGLLTPLMLATGVDPRDALFAYLVLLNLAVLGVAFFKRWRALDFLAFVGTWLLFRGWLVRFYDPSAMVPALLWMTALYLIFLILPFAYHLRHLTPVTVERFVLGLANAAVAFGYFYRILRADHQHVLGFVAIGMSACYVVLGAQFRKRVAVDVRGLFGFIGLAVVFLTLAAPLHLKLHGITLAWALEGPVLLYLGYRFRYRPVRIGGLVVVVLSVWRLFAVHWPLHHALFVPILNRQFASAMFVALGAAVYAAIHHWQRKDATREDRLLKLTSAVTAGFLAIVILQAEAGEWYRHQGLGFVGRCAPIPVWALGSLAFLAAGLRARSRASRVAGFVALFVGAVMALHLRARQMPGDYWLFLSPRFLAGFLVGLSIFIHGYGLQRYRERCTGVEQGIAKFLYASGTFFLLVVMSGEAHSFCLRTVSAPQQARWLARMSETILWGLYAAAMLSVGFWRKVRPLRLAALGLFGLTAAKLVLFDMAHVKQIYRILAFVVVGVLMVAASYLYHRLDKRVGEPPKPGE